MTEKRFAELESLENPHLAPLKSSHIISPGYENWANLTEEITEDGKFKGRHIAMIPKQWADYIAAAVNAFPELVVEVQRLREQLEKR